MAEITEFAYQDLREYVEANWNYIELGDSEENSILRLSTDDSRVEWVHSDGAKELQLKVTITGSDVDVALPTTFASSSIYKEAEGGEAYSRESFNQFTIEGDNDELTVVHSILIPQTI